MSDISHITWADLGGMTQRTRSPSHTAAAAALTVAPMVRTAYTSVSCVRYYSTGLLH